MRILAFFGADVKRKRPSFLRESFERGYTLLAMDVPAIGLAVSADVPYTLIDDWIDSEKMFQAKKQAAKCERKWYEASRDDFTAEDICWPEFDQLAMHWFWADVILARAFAEIFRKRGGKELWLFRNKIRRPAEFYYPSDIISALWTIELKGKIKTSVITQKPKRHTMLSYGWSEIRKIGKSISKWSTTKERVSKTSYRQSPSSIPPSVVDGKIVFAFNQGEFYRFTPIIQRLSEHFPQMVVVVLIWPNSAKATEVTASKWSFPVLCGPSFVPSDYELQKEKFLRGYVKAREADIGKPWQNLLEYLQFHFEYYSKERWPKLVSTFRSWIDLWSRTRPKAVIVSSLQDSESQIPAEAAKRCNIPTFSIPHGSGIWGRSWNVASSQYILHSLKTQKIIFERSGIASGKFIGCRGLVAQNEYPAYSTNSPTVSESWRVLALTDPIGVSGILAPHTSPRAQLAALNALSSPPSDVANNLSLRIKVHPNWPDIEVFASIKCGLEKLVLPTESQLKSVLRNTELVVAVNYSGAALVHVFRERKPVIFFWTDDLMGRSEPNLHADIFLQAGILVGSQKEFWDTVRAFFTDREFAEELRFKSYQYSDENLDDSHYPTLSEVLEEMLQDG